MAASTLRALREAQQAADKGGPSSRSPEPKRKVQTNEDDAKLDESQHTMLRMIGSMMDDKMGRIETWTQSKFENVQAQMDVVAAATDKNMTEMRKHADETKHNFKNIESTIMTMQQTMAQNHQLPNDDDDDRSFQVIAHGFKKETIVLCGYSGIARLTRQMLLKSLPHSIRHHKTLRVHANLHFGSLNQKSDPRGILIVHRP